jgi:hypothetical protein
LYILKARNINDAWVRAKHLLQNEHVVRPSRVGEVWEFPEPVCTVIERPLERVLFDPLRDCNPFGHFFESMWMLAGRDDVEFIAQFMPRMREFSNDGTRLGGAYGMRWRGWFEMYGGAEEGEADQLPKIARMLKANPNERRCVLGMWDPSADLDNPNAKDIPCNTHIYFKVREGKLDMTICNRSNDIVWGLYGANAVHMSYLLEWMAAMSGYPAGTMRTVSDSFHAYTERWEHYTGLKLDSAGGSGGERASDSTNSGETAKAVAYYDPYAQGLVRSYPIAGDAVALEDLAPTLQQRWDEDLDCWFDHFEGHVRNPYYSEGFFSKVVQPLYNAWELWKDRKTELAIRALADCQASDWRLACTEWLQRRLK